MRRHNYPYPSRESSHGTKCAGIVAAAANNGRCGVGIAFNARFGAIRINLAAHAATKAAALKYQNNYIHIYSSSWGPEDDGQSFVSLSDKVRAALETGAKSGRNGLGSIFVWAAGNGGPDFDSCAADAYLNSIYTIGITGVSQSGQRPAFAEHCANIFATTFGDAVVTTDADGSCTNQFEGSSAAAPMASGMIALALEANLSLTWRDVMHLIAVTARPMKAEIFQLNKRGFRVSSTYGFGLMDGGRMVEAAREWKSVAPMRTCSMRQFGYEVTYSNESMLVVTMSGCASSPSNEVNFIEQVELTVSLRANERGKLELYLTSPSGTVSLLLPVS